MSDGGTVKTEPADKHADALEFQPATSSNVLSLRGARVSYRIALPAAALLLGISMCLARNADAQQAATPPQSPEANSQKVTQILIPGFLTESLESKNRKPSEEVVVKTAGPVRWADGTVIPRGAKVVGHVTEAKARSGGDTESSLGIVFDKISLPDGKTLSITGVVRAVAPNPDQPDSGGGVTYADIAQTIAHSTPSAGGSSSVVPILTGESVGVQGIKNLQLGPDGVFKSNGRTVKLETGSQVILRVQLAGGD